jgi:hypothetical protein
MIRITDQYFWNVVFGIFFVLLVVMGAIILETEARIPYTELTFTDFALITLATWRLIRLFVYDAITKFLREQFYDLKKVGKGMVLEKPKFGPRRTLADLLSCPWCFGMWAAAGDLLLPPHPICVLRDYLPRYLRGSVFPPDTYQYGRVAGRKAQDGSGRIMYD